jgi:hypothetical protein
MYTLSQAAVKLRRWGSSRLKKKRMAVAIAHAINEREAKRDAMKRRASLRVVKGAIKSQQSGRAASFSGP